MTDDKGEPSEDRKERIDRELGELLQELRVALPGVQILFAFLLTIPFAQGFTKITGFEKYVYLAALLFATGATVLLITPTAYHRLHFREHEKEQLLITSNRLAIFGLAFLAIAMALAVHVITWTVFSSGIALIVSLAALACFTAFWYALPLRRKQKKAH